MRVEILRSPDKAQRRERADDEDQNSDPKRGRVHGIPVRLDGRDDGLDARLRQSEAAVAPVSGPEVQEAAAVRSFQPIGVDRRVMQGLQARAQSGHRCQSSKNVNETRRYEGPDARRNRRLRLRLFFCSFLS